MMRGMRLPSQSPVSIAKTSSVKRKNPGVRDLRSHNVGDSRVESPMEMRLGHFIDPTHQGGHSHRSVFGNGKLQCPMEGGDQNILQSLLNIRFFPEKTLHILHP